MIAKIGHASHSHANIGRFGRTSVRSAVRTFVQRVGFDLRPLSSVPFGVDWRWDLRSVLSRRHPQTVLDVGANQGQTALRVAEAFPTCHVFSFEPVPSTFEMLKANVHGSKTIQPVNAALGQAAGRIRITNDPGSGGNTTVLRSDEERPTVLVTMTTVDDFCDAHSIHDVDLLKIDTEGAEMSVLCGARRMLQAQTIRAVLTECDFSRRESEPHGDFCEIWSMLQTYGFRVCGFYSGGVDRDGWIWGDCLFIHPSALSQQLPPRCSPFG